MAGMEYHGSSSATREKGGGPVFLRSGGTSCNRNAYPLKTDGGIRKERPSRGNSSIRDEKRH